MLRSSFSLIRFSLPRRSTQRSARDGQRVRHEHEFVGPVADVRELLFDLGNVLVRERLVSVKRSHALRMMSVRRGLRA
jgi:hypothetical protein